MELIVHSEQETKALGAKLGRQLSPGAKIAFYGDLGAGKTAFIRGLACGLGIDGPITSPTYTIVNEYPGPIPLFHFDLYRLCSSDDLFDLGWEDYLERGGVVTVEWSERAADALRDFIKIEIRPVPGQPEHRRILIEGGDSFDLSP